MKDLILERIKEVERNYDDLTSQESKALKEVESLNKSLRDISFLKERLVGAKMVLDSIISEAEERESIEDKSEDIKGD